MKPKYPALRADPSPQGCGFQGCEFSLQGFRVRAYWNRGLSFNTFPCPEMLALKCLTILDPKCKLRTPQLCTANRRFMCRCADIHNSLYTPYAPAENCLPVLSIPSVIVSSIVMLFVYAYLGLSENSGTLFWGPYNKDPTI